VVKDLHLAALGDSIADGTPDRRIGWKCARRPRATSRRSCRDSHPHVELMPDAHLGKGATVGSAIPTLGAIVPAAVGVEIGCG